jgi:phenylacetate-coenzyme A ligase PaaK-like adenylate-forming protein
LPLRTIRHLGRISDILAIDNQPIPRIDLEQAVLEVPGTGLHCLMENRAGRLHVAVDVEAADPTAVALAVARSLFRRYGLRPRVGIVDRGALHRTMDTMLKPGSAALDGVPVQWQDITRDLES